MDDLEGAYRTIAAKGDQFRGLSIIQYAEQIGELIARTESRTLLDYGSGAGDAYEEPIMLHQNWGIEKPTLYDPAFPAIDQLPGGKFDGVVCSDVLEHVKEGDVEVLIQRLFVYAERFLWASVCCRPAKKFFADGTNMHITIRKMSWWRDRFSEAAAKKGRHIVWQLTETP